jgi:type I restriction enzyme M protein
MILHDVHFSDFDIKQEDTLEKPQHLGLKFDAIVANPPFSAHWSANPLFMNDDRFGVYGKLAPKSKADLAFVQHMVSQLSDEGTIAVVLPHGALFRGAAEEHIRQYLISELNVIDVVIGLPPNIFYGTSIPTCILVLKKCRKNPEDIFFIDASQDFEKAKTTNFIREDHIEKILSCYRERVDVKKYSNKISIEKIRSNKWSLNIPQYVETKNEEEEVELDTISKQLADLINCELEIDQSISQYCKELGIQPPFISSNQ